MKRLILFMLAMYCLMLNMQAQFCNNKSGCYHEDSCYSSSQIHSQDYKYATVKNIYKSATANVDLYMTIFSPCVLPVQLDSINNTFSCKKCSRPFILLIHGGGFRAGCRTAFNKECMEFAKRGYVVATIDYRLGWVPGDEQQTCNNNFCFNTECSPKQDDSCKTTYKDSMNFALYRAVQDAAAAMRFIVHYAANLNIDKNYLYIGGHSAGSITAANLCYTNQQEFNTAIPRVVYTLGALNGSGNLFTDTFKIAGLYNNWGSVIDTTFIKGKQDEIPMIAFHGIDDPIVPFGKGTPLSCANAAYGYTCGSSCLYNKLMNKYPNSPFEFYACYGGHGIFNDTPDKDPRSLYRVQKAVCFFYRARNGDKTKVYIRIDKQEDSISFDELDSTSPVNCNYTAPRYDKNFYSGNALAIQSTNNPGVIIYPNPVTTKATLLIRDEMNDIDVSIINSNEKILWHKNFITEKSISLPVRNLSGGLYLVMIKTKEYLRVIRFIKAN